MELNPIIHPVVGFFTLTQPWLLLFGVGALIPVFIHYLNRNRHLRMRWAATQYLVLALDQVAKRFSLIQILLLVVRVCVVLLLALCMASPMFHDDYDWFQQSGRKTTLKLIAIDHSFSMQAEQENRSSQGEAKLIAAQLVEQSRESESFIVFTFDSRLNPVITRPVATRTEVLAAIDLISLGNQATDVKQVLSDLSEISSNGQAGFDELEIHLVSDFMAKDWAFLESENAERNWENLLENTKVHLYRVGGKDLSNNFISAVSLFQSHSIVDVNNPVTVKVQNWGAKDQQDLLVDLLVDQNVVASKPVTIQPNGQVTATFDLVLGQEGNYLIEARIGPDCNTIDNRHFANVEAKKKHEVVFLEGKAGASKFLRISLDPAATGNSNINTRVIKQESFASLDLGGVDVLFVDNVRNFSEAEVRRLVEFATSGKTVFLFLGDLVNRNQFNAAWNRGDEKLGLELVGIQPVNNYEIDPLDFRSPYLQAFQGNPDAGLATLPIWTYFKVRIIDNSSTRVDLSLTNGDPLLVSKAYGTGRIVLFTSSSSSQSKIRLDDIPWNANETSAGFPALVLEMFHVSLQDHQPDTIHVGQIGHGEFKEQNRIDEFSFHSPEGTPLEIDVVQSDGFVSWKSNPLLATGFYEFSAKTGNSESTKTLAVNFDAAESDLRGITPPGEYHEISGPKSKSTSQSRSVQLFQILLLGLVLLLVTESVVGFQFGKENG